MTAKCIFFSSIHKIYVKTSISCTTGKNHDKFKEVKLNSVFSDHSGIKSGKASNTWKLSNRLLNKPWTKEEVSKETKARFGGSPCHPSTLGG